jgi:CTP synthase
MFIHATLLPYIPSAGELKTKPTQHSVKELLSVGIQPAMLLCRSDRPIPDGERRKIAQFCNVPVERVISALDAESIYAVPRAYHEQGLDSQVLRYFGLDSDTAPDLGVWDGIVGTIQKPLRQVRIAVVGKYASLPDAYKSLSEALIHGGIAHGARVHLSWLDAERFEDPATLVELSQYGGILVPGGFGERGTEGKIAAIRYAREQNIPFFGICLGMQMAVVEAARHLADIPGAGSTEFGRGCDPVVAMMTEWQRDGLVEHRDGVTDLGGTMRLGAYPCRLVEGSLAAGVYGQSLISERHRHRYEVNLRYKGHLEAAGLLFSGMSPDGRLPEIVELPGHPWFIGVQFHPELKSRPFAPHPLFMGFVGAALKCDPGKQ